MKVRSIDMSQPRRTPVQERSNDTVQSIFEAASALLSRMAVEEITTSRIAAEAGVSVGALYRFFSDKQAILDAIAVRHMADFRKRMALTLAGAALAAGPAALGKMIDAYVEFLDQRPDFRVLALGRHVSAVTRQAQIRPGAGPAGLLRWFMLKRLGLDDPARLDLKLEVAIEAGERLIAYAYEQEEPTARGRILEEVKKLLAGYLFPAKG